MPALEKFDPTRPLVACTFIRLHAVIYKKGDAVPYAEADHRNLERLYSLRKIAHGKGREFELISPREALMNRRAAEIQQQEAGEDLQNQTDEEKADELAKGHTKAQLLEMAEKPEPLEGVTDKQTKGEIALALVRAGRGAA